MSESLEKWEDFEKNLNITPEQEVEIQLEMDLIEATIKARNKSNLTQRQLSKKSGIKQPAIARIESRVCSPRVDTLLKMLYSIGYTLKVVPINENKKSENVRKKLKFKITFMQQF